LVAMKQRAMQKRKPILIPGETLSQRKCSVQRLLRSLGYSIDLQQIRQERGELWIRWEPPFSQELLKQMERFARHGTVYLVPDNTRPELAAIDLIFEREAPGLLFYRSTTMQGAVIVETIERLPQLYAEYMEQMKQVEEARVQIRAHCEQNPEPEQQGLWGEEDTAMTS
jgi:hypothetical protein